MKYVIMPILMSDEELARMPADVINQEWINDTHITYVVEDRPTATARYITQEDLRRWKMDLEELHERALANLVDRSHEVTMEGNRSDGCTMLSLQERERHNAARVLLPDFHKKLREHLGTTFYVAMPTRESLIAFASDRDEVIARVRRQVSLDYAKSDSPLSAKLFQVTADGVAGDPQEAENLAEWF